MEQTWFLWMVHLNCSCVQIDEVIVNARSKFNAHSLEHAIKNTLCESVCFSHNKKAGSYPILGNKFTVSNAFLYIYIYICVCAYTYDSES